MLPQHSSSTPRQVRAPTDCCVSARHGAPPRRATRETVEKAHRAARNGATRERAAARASFARARRAVVMVATCVHDAPARPPTRLAFLSVPPTQAFSRASKRRRTRHGKLFPAVRATADHDKKNPTTGRVIIHVRAKPDVVRRGGRRRRARLRARLAPSTRTRGRRAPEPQGLRREARARATPASRRRGGGGGIRRRSRAPPRLTARAKRRSVSPRLRSSRLLFGLEAEASAAAAVRRPRTPPRRARRPPRTPP